MTPTVPRKLQISAIRFLNPAPLMWDFEHAPEQSRLAERYVVHSTLPSQCADELTSKSSHVADIGLVPVTTYATARDLLVIPGCAIASLGAVRSILLVMRAGTTMKNVQRVAADPASRSSNAYTRILLEKFYGARPEFIAQTSPALTLVPEGCDAAVIIGDPALLALEHSAARESRTGERLAYIDLAEEWKRHTGLPWVSAFWAVRPEAMKESGLSAADITADFQRSRDHGLAHIDDLVAEWTPRIALPPAMIRDYLTQNIHYTLDDACLAGLDLFYRYAAELNILPAAPLLRFL